MSAKITVGASKWLEKKNAFDQHLLGQGTKADERRDEIMCNLKHCAELVM